MIYRNKGWAGWLIFACLLTACGGEIVVTTTVSGTPTAIFMAQASVAVAIETATPLAVPTFVDTPTAIVVPSITPTAIKGATPTLLAKMTPTIIKATPTVKVASAPAKNTADIVAPPGARQLNLTVAMLQKVQKRLGGSFLNTDLSALEVGAYANEAQPIDVFDFYRQEMTAKGWVESKKYNNRFGIYFTKGSQVAAIGAVGVPDDSTVAFLAGFIPEVKGQIKGGETLILVGQGPAKAFEILRTK